MSSNPPHFKLILPKIIDILNHGTYEFPSIGKYNGSGGPGRLLEDLLGIKENNVDVPDLRAWEVKFHGGASLLTLFHKDPEPRGVINQLVDDYGWDDKKGRISFRHTLCGRSDRGFYVVNEDNKIIIRNEKKEGAVPFWAHNVLLNAFPSKLRRLILIEGKVLKNPRRVTYLEAHAYWELDINGFMEAVVRGTFQIDFDARTNKGRGSSIRNHGTKFRIKIEDLPKIYAYKQKIFPTKP